MRPPGPARNPTAASRSRVRVQARASPRPAPDRRSSRGSPRVETGREAGDVRLSPTQNGRRTVHRHLVASLGLAAALALAVAACGGGATSSPAPATAPPALGGSRHRVARARRRRRRDDRRLRVRTRHPDREGRGHRHLDQQGLRDPHREMGRREPGKRVAHRRRRALRADFDTAGTFAYVVRDPPGDDGDDRRRALTAVRRASARPGGSRPTAGGSPAAPGGRPPRTGGRAPRRSAAGRRGGPRPGRRPVISCPCRVARSSQARTAGTSRGRGAGRRDGARATPRPARPPGPAISWRACWK